MLEIHVDSQRNVLNGFGDRFETTYVFMNCVGSQKFPEGILSVL